MNSLSAAVLLALSIHFIPFGSTLVYAKEPPVAKQAVAPAPSSAEQRKINLNQANVVELTGSFKGIGTKRAEAIIAYREAHQGFKSIDELADVKGLGQRFVDRNREQLIALYTIQ